jgi:hypothetical protein
VALLAQARLDYDWSDPRHITMTTTDSNTWGNGSKFVHTRTPQPGGATAVDVLVVRDGKNLKDKAIGLLLGAVGKGMLAKGLTKTVQAIEARNPAG